MQCENCHGPARAHLENSKIKPANKDPKIICVSCHQGSHSPAFNFDEVVTLPKDAVRALERSDDKRRTMKAMGADPHFADRPVTKMPGPLLLRGQGPVQPLTMSRLALLSH